MAGILPACGKLFLNAHTRLFEHEISVFLPPDMILAGTAGQQGLRQHG